MQIHVVSSGESLYSIANQYSVSMEEIVKANELDAPNDLVIGQALVIPDRGEYYFVQKGDSLYSIAKQYGLTAQELANINNIPVDQPLPLNLRLYIPPQPKVKAAFNGYAETYGDQVSKELEDYVREHAKSLSYLAPFSYEINRDGSLVEPPLNDYFSIAKQNNVEMMLVVNNIEEGGFSKELGRLIVTDATLQDKLLDNIIKTAKEKGFGDVHFDFEFLPPDTREDYNSFLRKAKKRLSAEGLQMSTALAPKKSAEQTGAWYSAHDYKAHGEIADFVVLMTYEWGYSGGPPMPVSPIEPVRNVVEYALSVMPAEKIFLGQNLYGYDWTLPYKKGNEPAEALSPQKAIRRARENNVEIQFDEEAKAPFYTYKDADGKKHEVWFEDARSIQAKFDLVKELGLKGVSYWKLGLPFPQNWELLENQFDVVKRS
ncbi:MULTISPECIES: glycoside hydrolase family 18 protein [Pontibacillus]|uniref:Glycoside hydrolase family 18 protein n=1 Tax=Pontibacillus chungwhensis TaxID=265426 RepID=A0ABY8V0K8_9BACI|nr:glycoside hydrolase family 18 protein [Pontibacillus chungwhensis]MCD5325582.1 glycoside hydrolase family 18 protein [Pontibacillus sp. HN14]WIF98169.1 glycoside hydrolase family 18 protein [Pontibacillus chungwhensis]